MNSFAGIVTVAAFAVFVLWAFGAICERWIALYERAIGAAKTARDKQDLEVRDNEIQRAKRELEAQQAAFAMVVKQQQQELTVAVERLLAEKSSSLLKKSEIALCFSDHDAGDERTEAERWRWGIEAASNSSVLPLMELEFMGSGVSITPRSLFHEPTDRT